MNYNDNRFNNSESDNEFYDLFIQMKSKLITILIIICATTLLGIFFTLFITPKKYKADTTLIIQSHVELNSINYDDIYISRELINTYKEIILSDRILKQVINSLGLEENVDQLTKLISVSSVPDTEIINIEVLSNDPIKSMVIANKLSYVFIDEVVDIMKINNVKLIDRAIQDDNHVSPSLILNTVLSLILGIVLGLSYFFVLFLLDDTLKTKKDIKRISDLNIIGTVEDYLDNNGDQYSIISIDDPTNEVIESYRKIRTNIEYSNIDTSIKVINFTSSIPSEGKTTTIANLAALFADLNKSVLLIDLDLRKPKIHRYFKLRNRIGIVDIIFKNMDFQDVVNHVSYGLDVLTSGTIPPFSSELLSSKKFKNFIDSVRADYDLILLDGPPLLVASDSAIVSNISDSTIFIVASSKIHVNEFKDSIHELEQIDANILGIVLTKVEKKHLNYYRYKYTSYHSYD